MHLPRLHLLSLVASSYLYAGHTTAQVYPSPGPCTGDCVFVQDVSVIIGADGTYYRFAGHNGIEIATAPALIGPWKNSTVPAFPTWRESLAYLKPSLQDLWAPDVRKIGDLYYMFFGAENFGTGLYGAGNAASAQYGESVVATSSSLAGGTWKIQNVLNIPIHGPQYTRFDTSLLVVGDAAFISFGSYSWGLYGMYMQSPPLQVLDQTVTELVADTTVPISALNTAPNKTESSYLYERNGFYYLFFSSGDCCPLNRLAPNAEYNIMYCRATSVTGPYYSRTGENCLTSIHGTVLLSSHGDSVYAPGSPCILDDPQHGLVMIYQYMNPKVGYGEPNLTIGWNPLLFDNDGWPALGEALSPQVQSSSGSATAPSSITAMPSVVSPSVTAATQGLGSGSDTGKVAASVTSGTFYTTTGTMAATTKTDTVPMSTSSPAPQTGGAAAAVMRAGSLDSLSIVLFALILVGVLFQSL